MRMEKSNAASSDEIDRLEKVKNKQLICICHVYLNMATKYLFNAFSSMQNSTSRTEKLESELFSYQITKMINL